MVWFATPKPSQSSKFRLEGFIIKSCLPILFKPWALKQDQRFQASYGFNIWHSLTKQGFPFRFFDGAGMVPPPRNKFSLGGDYSMTGSIYNGGGGIGWNRGGGSKLKTCFPPIPFSHTPFLPQQKTLPSKIMSLDLGHRIYTTRDFKFVMRC